MLYMHMYSHNIYIYIHNVYLYIHKAQIMSQFFSFMTDTEWQPTMFQELFNTYLLNDFISHWFFKVFF